MSATDKSGWNWMPPPDEGIWRYGAPWMRPVAASAPWIAFALVLAIAALAGGRFAAAPGVSVELPGRLPATTAQETPLAVLVLPLEREAGGGDETFVFFDDSRFTLSDRASAAAFKRSLAERSAAERARPMLVLADRRVPAGDLLALAALVREAGIKSVQIARKKD